MFTLLTIIYIASTMICELSRRTRRKKAEGHLQQHSGHNTMKFEEVSAHVFLRAYVTLTLWSN